MKKDILEASCYSFLACVAEGWGLKFFISDVVLILTVLSFGMSCSASLHFFVLQFVNFI